jgi:MFS family permease
MRLRLAKINAMSFLAQVVQIGTVPALFAIQLSAAHYSTLVIGVIAAAPWLAILCTGHLAPAMLARLGFVATSAWGLGLSALALVGALFSPAAPVLFALNFLFGVGLILRWIASDTWILAVAPGSMRGQAIGVHETLMGCGIAAAPLVLALAGVTGRAPIVVCLALLLGGGICLLLLMDEDDAAPGAPPKGGAAWALAAMPTAIASGFVAGYVETASISFLPVFSSQATLALGVVTVLAAFGVGGTVLQVPVGRLADRVGYRFAQLTCAVVLLGGFPALLAVAGRPPLLLALLFLLGGAAGGMNTLAVIEGGHRANRVGVSSAMVAVALSYTIGSALGPFSVGLAASRQSLAGFAWAIAGAALVFLAAFAIAAKLPPTSTPEETAEGGSI